MDCRRSSLLSKNGAWGACVFQKLKRNHSRADLPIVPGRRRWQRRRTGNHDRCGGHRPALSTLDRIPSVDCARSLQRGTQKASAEDRGIGSTESKPELSTADRGPVAAFSLDPLEISRALRVSSASRRRIATPLPDSNRNFADRESINPARSEDFPCLAI